MNSKENLSSIKTEKLISWISSNKTILTIFLFSFLLLFPFFYRISNTSSTNAKKDYLLAQIYLDKLISSSAKEKVLAENPNFQKLEAILTRRPELGQKYDSILAQLFIIQDDISLANKYSKKVFTRLKHSSFKEFAKNSLRITNADYEKALSSSLSLNTDNKTLKSFNLLRIAFLNQWLGKKENEIKAWDTFSQYTKLEAKDSTTSSLSDVLQSFQEGKNTFIEYIKLRKSQ